MCSFVNLIIENTKDQKEENENEGNGKSNIRNCKLLQSYRAVKENYCRHNIVVIFKKLRVLCCALVAISKILSCDLQLSKFDFVTGILQDSFFRLPYSKILSSDVILFINNFST